MKDRELQVQFQFSHVWVDVWATLGSLLGQSWASLGPVARADDGRAADNGPLLTGRQVDEVLEVVCSSSSVLREWFLEIQEVKSEMKICSRSSSWQWVEVGAVANE